MTCKKIKRWRRREGELGFRVGAVTMATKLSAHRRWQSDVLPILRWESFRRSLSGYFNNFLPWLKSFSYPFAILHRPTFLPIISSSFTPYFLAFLYNSWIVPHNQSVRLYPIGLQVLEMNTLGRASISTHNLVIH